MGLERLPLLRELSLLQKLPYSRLRGVGGESGGGGGGGAAAAHKLVFLLFYFSSAPLGTFVGTHTAVCLSCTTILPLSGRELLTGVGLHLVASLSFPSSLCSVARRAERSRAGQQAGDGVQINQLLRARLGPVLHMKALGKWTLDLWFLDKV